MTDVKIVTHALLQYTSDYDGRLPNALEWPQATVPYFQEEHWGTFHCPQDDRPWRNHRGRQRTSSLDKFSPRSYDMLQALSHQALAPEETGAQAILLYEIGDWGLAYRHNEGMNLSFEDGHVEWAHKNSATPAVILGGVYSPEKVKLLGK